jgi:hypothetical protein
MNCGERNASPADIEGSAVAAGPATVPCVGPGGRRTNSAAGISSAQATMPIVIIAVRQS